MGNCITQTEKKSKKAAPGLAKKDKKVTDLNKMSINKSDFITRNNGKFRESY